MLSIYMVLIERLQLVEINSLCVNLLEYAVNVLLYYLVN